MFLKYVRKTTKENKVSTYLYIAESYRVGKKVRQRAWYLGRLEKNRASLVKITEKLITLLKGDFISTGKDLLFKEAKEFGPSYIFRRLWEASGMKEQFRKITEAEGLSFDLGEAIFEMVLNRLAEPLSKRGMFLRWREGQYLNGKEEPLQLHHYYRALDHLSMHIEEIEDSLWKEKDQLFGPEVRLVFFDTTSSYFEGEGPSGLAAYGFSKDHRPERKQIVIVVAMREDGLPLMHKIFEGSKADVSSFKEVSLEVKRRFGIKEAIVVADRGCVSEDIIKGLSEAGLGYILGARLRTYEAREALSSPGRYRKVSQNLKVKEVSIRGRRYIVCLNEEEAKRQKHERGEILKTLEEKLKGGAKSLIANKGYRKYLKAKGEGFEIDRQKAEAEANYDGKWVIITNTTLSTESAALSYKRLWEVERAFRDLKNVLEIRPIYHWSERRVRGHIGVCFLALYLQRLFMKKLDGAGLEISWGEVIWELRQIKAGHFRAQNSGDEFWMRTELSEKGKSLFKALKMAFPMRVWKR